MTYDNFIKWIKRAFTRVELLRLINIIMWVYLPFYTFNKFFNSVTLISDKSVFINVLSDDIVLFVSWSISVILVVFGIKLCLIKIFSSNLFYVNYFVRYILPINYRYSFKQLLNYSVSENINVARELLAITKKSGITTNSIKTLYLYIDIIIKLIVIVAVSGNFSELSELIVSCISIFLLIGLLTIFLRDMIFILGIDVIKNKVKSQ